VNPLDHYFTIAQPSNAEFKDRGSRFLSFAFPMDNKETFKKELAAIKGKHPKAVHHCFAYRIGLEGVEFRSSDDGEPAGSAGKPILGQIDSKQLTNLGIVVVRYFGGTLLGVPGLINAYKTAASLALQTTPIIKKPVLERYLLLFNYTEINEVMRVLKPAACEVFEQDLQLFSHIKVGIPVSRKKEVIYLLSQVRGMEIKKSL
jgi:uncharacterized YigZ family protein